MLRFEFSIPEARRYNPAVLLRIKLKILIFAAFASVAACSQAAGTQTPPPTQALILFQTATASATPLPVLDTPAQPSATPQIYLVVKDDTLFAIAARHEITVAALMAANPGVDPLVLTPGTELIIPAEGATPVPAIPSPTPVAAQLGAVDCYLSALGEVWCFLLVTNQNSFALENITGVVQLLSDDGDILAELEAVPPLNVLPPGSAMPLVAYLDAAPADWDTARGRLLSAYSLAADNDYYLDVDLVGTDIAISANGLSAQVSGQVRLTGEQAAGELWVLAVAYDEAGAVVGVRKWESTGELEFDLWVYSLGPDLAEVKLLVEARP